MYSRKLREALLVFWKEEADKSGSGSGEDGCELVGREPQALVDLYSSWVKVLVSMSSLVSSCRAENRGRFFQLKVLVVPLLRCFLVWPRL